MGLRMRGRGGRDFGLMGLGSDYTQNGCMDQSDEL